MISKYPGDDQFQKKLTSVGVSMSVFDIKMLLAGVLLSPEMVPPSAVLEQILEGDEEDYVTFKDEESYAEFMDMFMGLWNVTVDYDNGGYPTLRPDVMALHSDEEKVEYILKTADEIVCFYMGMELSGADEYLYKSYELHRADMELDLTRQMLEDFSYDYEIENSVTDEDIKEILEQVYTFHKIWPNKYKELNSLFQKVRKGEIKLLSEKEMIKKIKEELRESD